MMYFVIIERKKIFFTKKKDFFSLVCQSYMIPTITKQELQEKGKEPYQCTIPSQTLVGRTYKSVILKSDVFPFSMFQWFS